MKNSNLTLIKQSIENGEIKEEKTVGPSELNKNALTIITVGEEKTNDVLFSGMVSLLSHNQNNKLSLHKLCFDGNDINNQEGQENLIQKFATEVLMPRIFKKNGKPLPSDEARENLRCLNFITTGKGSKIVESALYFCREKLVQNGMHQHTANLLMKNSLHISINSAEDNFSDGSLATTVSFSEIAGNKDRRNFYFGNDDEKYLGPGKFCYAGNKLCLVADSFVGEQQKFFKKLFGVNDNEQIENMTASGIQILFNNEHFLEKSQRVLMLQKMIKRCLSLSIQNYLENKKGSHFLQFCSLEELEQSLTEILDEQRATLFENKQQKFGQYKNFGKPLQDTMHEFNITYHQLINGEVKNIEEFLEAAQNFEGEKVEIDFTGTDLNINMLILNLDKNNLQKSLHGYEYLLERNISLNPVGIIMQDGNSFSADIGGVQEQKEWISDSAIAIKINRKPIMNNITYKLLTNNSDSSKNQIVIESGFMFKGDNFDDVNDLKAHQVCSTNGDYELSEAQTRVVINLAIATKTPLENIKLPPQMMLNRAVLRDEMLKTLKGIVVRVSDF